MKRIISHKPIIHLEENCVLKTSYISGDLLNTILHKNFHYDIGKPELNSELNEIISSIFYIQFTNKRKDLSDFL